MNQKQLAQALLIISTISAIFAWFGNIIIAVPFGLMFSILIPGTLIYLGFRQNLSISWSSLAYIVGLGVTFLMFGGVAINSIGRVSGIAHPLTEGMLTVGIILATIVLSSTYKRWGESPLSYTPIRLSREQKTLIAVSLLTLLGYIAGALRLNNNASVKIGLISYLVTPILFIYMLIRAKTLKPGVIVFTLWMLGLGILLSGSLRSVNVSGPDISLEYAISQAVKNVGYWNINTFKNGYNACLSIGILAPSLSLLTKLSVALVYKLLIPIMYTLIVPVVYLISRSFLSDKGALITAFFFISQPVFVVWWWIPERQQIAFFLFSLLVLMIVDNVAKSRSRHLLFLFLAAGLIVSHYSTASLAIVYLFLALLLKKILSYKKNSISNGFTIITSRMLLVLFIGYFAWYSQITYGFNGVVGFTSKSISNLTSLFSTDNQAGGQGLISQFNIFANPGQSTTSFSDYVSEANQATILKFGPDGAYHSDNKTEFQTTYGQTDSKFVSYFTLIRKFIIITGKVIILSGIICMSFFAWNPIKRRRYTMVAAPALFLLGATILLPFFSISYDQVRTYQQMLICMGGVYGLILVLPKKYVTKATYTLGIFVVTYFLLVSGTWAFFTTSPSVPAGLSNNSFDSIFYYAHDSDLAAAKWLKKSTLEKSIIVADNFAVDKLRLALNPNQSTEIYQNLVPSAIPKKSFVVSTRTNQITNDAFASVNNTFITYTFPYVFLSVNKNIVYSNGSDAIYY